MKPVFFTLILISLFSKSSFAQVNLSAGLVAYYPFNGNANDASGNGNNASFNNATLTTDYYGTANSAYSFNGSTSYIQIPNSSTLNISTNKISLCMLVRPSGYYSGPCDGNLLIAKQHGDYIDGNYSLRFQDIYTGCSAPDHSIEIFSGSVGTASNNGSLSAPAPYVHLNQWYCVVYTNDGTTGKIYVDGVLRASSAVTSSFSLTNAEDLLFGRMNNASYPYWFNGTLDEVRIYNRAINSQEVSALCPSALPVTVTSFNASPVNKKQVNLSWATQNEFNTQKYTVERSINGSQSFIPIGTVMAKSGLSNNYEFADNNIKTNISYTYRLSISDKDGTTRYSENKNIKIADNSISVIAYPNPAHDNLNLTLYGYSGKANLTIFNTVGQVVLSHSVMITDGVPFTTDLSRNAKGLYQVKIDTDKGCDVERILLQ